MCVSNKGGMGPLDAVRVSEDGTDTPSRKSLWH